MAALQQLEKDASTFQSLVEGGKIKEASSLLPKLKIQMTQFSSLPPSATTSSTSTKERFVARQILEHAAILSVKMEDMKAFERNITQLRVYYTDFNSQLPESKLHFSILGMRLLHYLVENRIAEFHSQLELVPETSRLDPSIAYAIKVEQWLMEGSYSKVLEARNTLPHPDWKPFIEKLLETVREAIAECVQVAYQSLSFQEAQQLLIFSSKDALLAYVTEQKPEWQIKNESLWFTPPKQNLQAQDIPSMRLIKESLAYATELDRIV